MQINKLRSRFKKENIVIMDGGLGTEILRRGYNTSLPLWSAEILITNPQIVKEIHKDYINAGAEIIITDTFRTTRRSFYKKNIHGRKAKELTILACDLACQAIKETKSKNKVLIAGSVAPLEDCYSPESTPSEKDLEIEHLAYARDLKEGGVDFLLIETMITLRELRYALKAAQKINMPVAVSFCCNEKLQLLGGEKLKDIVLEIGKYKPLFIGVNCVSREIAEKTVKYLHTLTKLPICVYAQGDGIPNKDEGWKFYKDKNLDLYMDSARRWVRDGATIIGGCCGTTPLYIQNLTKEFKI
jgi:homocysteine S-methyltransferase